MKRVVVTGMGAITALGDNWASFEQALRSQTSAIVRMEEWAKFKDFNTNLAGPVTDFVTPKYARKKIRSMLRNRHAHSVDGNRFTRL